MPKFKEFLEKGGLSKSLQREINLEFTATVDPRWQHSACDRIVATGKYRKTEIKISSTEFGEDGVFGVRISGKMPFGTVRSEPLYEPLDAGKTIAYLLNECDRIASLKWYQKLPHWTKDTAEILLGLAMCFSFVFLPQTEDQKYQYGITFGGLSVVLLANQLSKTQESDSLIDSDIKLR